MMDLVCILDNVQFIVMMDSIWHLGWYPFTNAGSPIPKSGLSRLLDPMSASLPVSQGVGITRVLHRYSMVQIVQHCTLNHQHCTHTGYGYILPIEVWLLHKTAGCYKPVVIHSHGFCDLRRTIELISYSRNKWTHLKFHIDHALWPAVMKHGHMGWPSAARVPHGYGSGQAGQNCTHTHQHHTCTGYSCTLYPHANGLAKNLGDC